VAGSVWRRLNIGTVQWFLHSHARLIESIPFIPKCKSRPCIMDQWNEWIRSGSGGRRKVLLFRGDESTQSITHDEQNCIESDKRVKGVEHHCTQTPERSSIKKRVSGQNRICDQRHQNTDDKQRTSTTNRPTSRESLDMQASFRLANHF
jgi:hypothetical protein